MSSPLGAAAAAATGPTAFSLSCSALVSSQVFCQAILCTSICSSAWPIAAGSNRFPRTAAPACQMTTRLCHATASPQTTSVPKSRTDWNCAFSIFPNSQPITKAESTPMATFTDMSPAVATVLDAITDSPISPTLAEVTTAAAPVRLSCIVIVASTPEKIPAPAASPPVIAVATTMAAEYTPRIAAP